jgi:hypothetical protein
MKDVWGEVKTSYTPEEVRKIEGAAYEAGKMIGEHEEYKRIMYLIDKLEESSASCSEVLGVLVWTGKLESMIRGD